jgi:3-hydroxyacyl-[acyl-carrier-protein] dehydratase
MRWMWIDRVVELVPAQRLVAIKHVSMAEEHLHDHFAASASHAAQPIMPMSLIVEGMAQTAGIMVGHAEQFRHKVILAKVSKAEVRDDATPGCTLRYTATMERMDATGASTRGVVELCSPQLGREGAGGSFREVGTIDLMFSHLDNNMQGLTFPEHNFVFGEGFKTLLRMSGVIQ